MSDILSIEKKISELKSLHPKNFLEGILSAFGIAPLTIQKIIASAEKDSFKSPIPVYRRAAFFFSENQDGISLLEDKLGSTYRLLVSIDSKEIHCKNTLTLGERFFEAGELGKHIDFFYPLIYGFKNEKDVFATLSYSSLISELFNELALIDENNFKESPTGVTNFILDLMTVGFFGSFCENQQTQKFLNWSNHAKDFDYEFALRGFLDEFLKEFKFQNTLIGYQIREVPISINKRCFDLCIKILASDVSEADGEILGPLIYKFVKEDDQAGIFGYYTSYENIEKVFHPLFIDETRSRIKAAGRNMRALDSHLSQLANQKFFDPTNSPGSFLAAAFNATAGLIGELQNSGMELLAPVIDIRNFVGLVENTVVQRLAHLSLWVTHLQYLMQFNKLNSAEALSSYANIRISLGNQLAVDWNSVCANTGKTILIGSPSFKGAKKLTPLEKEGMKNVFGDIKCGDLDFSSCWLLLAARYIQDSASKSSLVLTNSICQGIQVAILWKEILKLGCEISFAYRSFKWRNGSSSSSGVSVVIVGLNFKSEFHKDIKKIIFSGGKRIVAKNISPYLIDSSNILVEKSTTPISNFLPPMVKGNMPYDDQNLLLNDQEMRILLNEYPESRKYLKRIVGSDEFINSIERWCVWLPSDDLPHALTIPLIKDRVERVRIYRESKTDKAAKNLATRPHQFREFRSTLKQSLVIPSVSSENRAYIPIGFIGKDTIVSNLAFAIYECEPWIFGVISSRIHMAWIRTVCGALETRIRYSSRLGYNTFPFPAISEEQKSQITSLVVDIIAERENYSEISLGALYSDLPQSLLTLHGYLDKTIDSCYSGSPFENDMDRLAVLFQLYEKLSNK